MRTARSASHQIDDATSLFPPTVDPASSSPYLLAPLGEFAATMLGVGLRPFYCHLAASLFLRFLFLPVPCRHGFVVRPACVIQRHFVCSLKNSLYRLAICRGTSFLKLPSELLAQPEHDMAFIQPTGFPLPPEAAPISPQRRAEQQYPPDHDAPHCVGHIILFTQFSIYTDQ
jgi:hypothetical protein